MPQNFLCPQRDQPMLLPVDMREWLPDDDLVYVILDAVATLDLGGFRRSYRADGHGRAASGPEMMVVLLLYGYCQGERSSRVIERRCVRGVAYRVIAGGLHPDHATIARLAGAAGGGPGPAGGRGSGPPRRAASQARSLGRGRGGRETAQRAAARATSRARTGPTPSPRANTTDPDVRVMHNQKEYVADYNGQLVVTAQQVIVGAMLRQHPVDRTLLHPVLDTCRRQLAGAGIKPRMRTMLADSGYVSEDNFTGAEADGLRLLAPLGKDPATRRASNPARPRDLAKLPATARRPADAPPPRPGRLQAPRPDRGTSDLPDQDLPEDDHDVPPRLHRLPQRMAARRYRA